MSSANYVQQAMKGIKDVFNNGVQDDLNVYQDNRVFDFYTTSEVFEIFTSTEGMTGVKELGESETPPVLALEDGYKVIIEEKRFGGAIVINEKMYARDAKDTTMKVDNYLAQQSAQLMKSNTHYFLTESFDLLNDAFTGAKFKGPDNKNLIATDHTWKSGATFSNMSTAALSEAAIDAAWEYAGAFTAPDGKPMPLNWTHIIVKKGSANARIARKMFAENISPVAVGDINIYIGALVIIETPYITAANKNCWFLRDANLENSLKVGVGQYPTMHDPIILENQAYRANVTGFFKLGIVNLSFDWYGSNGTT